MRLPARASPMGRSEAPLVAMDSPVRSFHKHARRAHIIVIASSRCSPCGGVASSRCSQGGHGHRASRWVEASIVRSATRWLATSVIGGMRELLGWCACGWAGVASRMSPIAAVDAKRGDESAFLGSTLATLVCRSGFGGAGVNDRSFECAHRQARLGRLGRAWRAPAPHEVAPHGQLALR